ncbi:immediate early response 3-interacting protein 1 [Brevipalpus obovatus]|uniref:immediate early response 3-interacting protein 1 n=1 Tax=Brevipalpus obovatus TaxID=246614 RepID=UPI003D9F718F
MAFTLYYLLEASLLVLNAITILHEDRFLSKIGWGKKQNSASMAYNQAYGNPYASGTRDQLYDMFHSARTVAKIPLIFINTLVIIFKLVAG